QDAMNILLRRSTQRPIWLFELMVDESDVTIRGRICQTPVHTNCCIAGDFMPASCPGGGQGASGGARHAGCTRACIPVASEDMNDAGSFRGGRSARFRRLLRAARAGRTRGLARRPHPEGMVRAQTPARAPTFW